MDKNAKKSAMLKKLVKKDEKQDKGMFGRLASMIKK